MKKTGFSPPISKGTKPVPLRKNAPRSCRKRTAVDCDPYQYDLDICKYFFLIIYFYKKVPESGEENSPEPKNGHKVPPKTKPKRKDPSNFASDVLYSALGVVI
jgi:hypothetical protein